ncbi:hypothetical protein CC80DRAFT_543959 [Byssothecium circinans]|uniref:lytic cellulose monooxygenase (C4-dehydrogenating) n=1 Tax=Byssothecium circinans TaxID=147558 RepID=A0A6A5U6Q7_9PLEO|nr:hypothetical protein CC80DRAFT_543959 [Byssothecium circinans]
MASKTFIAILIAAASSVDGHLTFVRVAHNSVWQTPTRFIRNKTDPYYEPYHGPGLVDTGTYAKGYRGYHFPTEWYNEPTSVRCGRDSLSYAANTEVLKLKAGDELEYAHQINNPEFWTDDMWVCEDGRGSCDNGTPQLILHPGPVVAHLSKIPKGQNIHNYDGSGPWLKIYTLGLKHDANSTRKVNWLPWNNEDMDTPIPRFVFKIPAQTPAGHYLLRIDLIWVHATEDKEPAQFYPSCTQIEVTSEVKGDLPQGGILIPEGLAPDQPGFIMSGEMYRKEELDDDYLYPGGPVWDGESLREDKPSKEYGRGARRDSGDQGITVKDKDHMI